MDFLTYLVNNFNQYPDSYKFLMTARFFIEGTAYEAIQTSLFYKWLYPAIIAVLTKVSGLNLMTSAHLIAQTSGLLAVLLTGIIVTKLFKSWRLGIIASLLLLMSGARLYWSSIINPEPLNLLLEAVIVFLAMTKPNPFLLGGVLTLAMLNKPEDIIWLFPVVFFTKDKKVLLATLGLVTIAYLTIWVAIKPNPLSIATGSVALTNLQTLLTNNFIVSNFKTDFVLLLLGLPGLVYLTIKERRLGIFLGLLFLGPLLVYLMFNLTLEKYLVNLLLPLTIGASYLISRPRIRPVLVGAILTSLLIWQTVNFVRADLPRLDYEQDSAKTIQAFLASRRDVKPTTLVTARFEPYELATNITGSEPSKDVRPNTLAIIDEATRLRFPDFTNQVLMNPKMKQLTTFNPTGDFILSGAKYNPTKPVAVFYLEP